MRISVGLGDYRGFTGPCREALVTYAASDQAMTDCRRLDFFRDPPRSNMLVTDGRGLSELR